MGYGVEDMIQEIAVKHGVAVDRDDPIMILHTLNESLHRENVIAQQNILKSFQEDLELISHKWESDAKQKAERILNAALDASKDSMSRILNEGAKTASSIICNDVDAKIQRTKKIINKLQMFTIVNIFSSVLTLISAILLLLSVPVK